MDNDTLWKIIDSQFNEIPQHLVLHHIESYNDFFKKDIYEIFRDQNPVRIVSSYDESIRDYRHKCNLYFGGKDGTKLYYGKPVIHDRDRTHYMYPNEARLRNMTYAMTIHYDVDVEFVDTLEPGQAPYEIGPEFLDPATLAQTVGADNSGDAENYDDANAREAFDQSIQYKRDGGGLPLDEPNAADGGAPRNNRAKDPHQPPPTKQFAITPALAAALRSALERSMVDANTQKRTLTLEKIYLGRFPVMVQSEFCILSGMPREMRFGLGECRNDIGGYFIIQGKEKTVVVQEKFGDNMMYLRKGKVYIDDAAADNDSNLFVGPAKDERASNPDKYLYSIEMRSVSENVSKPQRTLSVKLLAPSLAYSNMNIVVSIPNVRAPVPLFILFRALGVISDKKIIEMCLLDTKRYEFMMESFAPSVHDANFVVDQYMALAYIGELTKFHNPNYALEILSDFLLPHVGETNYLEKAYFLGHMVFQLLCAQFGLEKETDRDNLRFKRVELFGALFRGLFHEYYIDQQKHVFREFDKSIYFNNNQYEHNLSDLILTNYHEVFKARIVDDGVRKAFRGSWGGKEHTKRVGIVQDLNRLSFNSVLSHLRKMNLPLDASVKLVGPRVLHNSHWGYIDPIDTPDGGNIGIHKTFAISTYVSRGYGRAKIIDWLFGHTDIRPIAERDPLFIADQTKVFVNGHWCGVVRDPIALVSKFRLYRRNALIPLHTSIAFDIRHNSVFVYTDAGRICRPIFYKDDITGKLSFDVSAETAKRIRDGQFRWTDLVAGTNERKPDAPFHINDVRIYELGDLYALTEKEAATDAQTQPNPAAINRFIKNKSVVEYVDPNEVEHSLIALSAKDWVANPKKHKLYTHLEIHHSYLFGTMCNQVIFPENNPAVRSSFSCSQSRQACSMYHTNFQNRMDKTAVVLHNPQIPILKSRYYKHLHGEENNYGENVIVAIMCWTGYNVEDAILINQGALDRGLFHTTYYSSYQAHEERDQTGDVTVLSKFAQIESDPTVGRLKPGCDYSKLDANGLIRENEEVNEKTVLIGMAAENSSTPGVRADNSVVPKKGQMGVVDRAFITVGEEGERIAKVRVREVRVPNLGDKMASRAGQKGTCGMVIAEADMPFTKDGVKPDLIINPHALPTRQTIGHLVECLIGKTCLQYGGFSDCTAFNSDGSTASMFGEVLSRAGYHSSGNEIMYDGQSGKQIEMEIFMGPNYYMRLKHMVKDKINYRALGPRSALTRQTVGGRANDGGLRIGEMERDVLVAHGINQFLNDSMMKRGDEYQVAVCNMSGMMAIYNPGKNLFLSPAVDGPLKFNVSDTNRGVALDTISKYGRSFSIVSIPYSLKLLIQELQAINIQLRIITEDNIRQIESMSYSDNIKTLTLDADMTPAKLIQQIVATLKLPAPAAVSPVVNSAEEVYQPSLLRKPDNKTPDGSPAYPSDGSPAYPSDGSPAYRPDGSPAYRPDGSPAYQPNGSPAYPSDGSPAYQPNGSPAYRPDGSPAYQPNGSPAYPSDGSPAYQPELGLNGPGAESASSPGFRGNETKNEMTGGRRSADTDDGGVNKFGLGQAVYFRRSMDIGLAPDQTWRVSKKGAKLLTIQCPPEMMRDGEFVQLATPDEIMEVDGAAAERMRQIIAAQRSSSALPYPDGRQPHMAMNRDGSPYGGPHGGPYGTLPQQINVSPIIKIMSGNHNKMEREQDGETAGGQGPADATTFSDFQTGGGSSSGSGSGNASSPKSKKHGGQDAAAPGGESSSIFGGMANRFKELVINKLL